MAWQESVLLLGKQLTNFVLKLEGPYKWYVIAFVAIFLTAAITRFIFKTFKWFLLFILIGIAIFAILWLLADLSNL